MLFAKKSYPRTCLLILGGEERASERGRDVDRLPLTCTLTGHRPRDLGMRPDPDSNPDPLDYGSDTPAN